MQPEESIASTAQPSFTAPDGDVLSWNSYNDSGEGNTAWAQRALEHQTRSGPVQELYGEASDRSELATSGFSESLYGRPVSFWGSAISVALERADVPEGLKLEPGWETWKFYRDEFLHEFKQLGSLLGDFGCGPGPAVIMHGKEIRSFADPKQIITANVIFRRLTDTNKALRVITEWMQTLSEGPLRTFVEGEVTQIKTGLTEFRKREIETLIEIKGIRIAIEQKPQQAPDGRSEGSASMDLSEGP